MLPKLLTSWLPVSKKPSRWRQPLLGIEYLEDRTMLDASLSPDIVVGRTLSTYTVAGVQNHSVDITYTVYNEQVDDVTGVLLTTTLQPGVTFKTASAMPDQSGQNLAWSLGTIHGFDRTSVTLTVALPATPPLQLDGGAHAFGTLDAGMVTNDTPAAALQNRTIPADQLASTPDANTTDPFVQEEAAKLRYDPQRIFDFLHTQVGYNSYLGSLRGARGTLWSSAGNALDVASLGVALMRASGIPAQYESGTLTKAQAQPLILSMFPASDQTVGYIPAGTPTADPANDSQLLTETESHYWFRFDAGQGMQDADPLMAGATVGQTFTSTTGTFTEVADSLRAKTEVKLKAEIYSQGAAAFGISNGLGTTTVLDQTFNGVDLVGRSLSVGNVVSTTTESALAFTTVTNTYTPYFDLNDAANPVADTLISGQAYQEVLTTLPFGSEVVTGLFLDLTMSGPQGTSVSSEVTLVDRIGFAARQGNVASTSVSVNPTNPSILSDADLYTLDISPSALPASVLEPLARRASVALGALSAVQLEDYSSSEAVVALRGALIAYQGFGLASFAVSSATEVKNLAAVSLVDAYLDRSPITIFSSKYDPIADSFDYSFNLLRETERVVAYPGQGLAAIQSFNLAKGLADNAFEDTVLAPLSDGTVLGTVSILQQAFADNIPFTTLTSANLTSLGTLGLSADVKSRITDAVEQGRVVMTPVQDVTLDGTQTISWLEFDPATGELSGVLADGTRSAIINQQGGRRGLPTSRRRSLSSRHPSYRRRKRRRMPPRRRCRACYRHSIRTAKTWPGSSRR